MWRSDLREQGQHGIGKLGWMSGPSLVSNGENGFIIEASRKPMAQNYHWRTAKAPVTVYEVDELRDLSSFSLSDIPIKNLWLPFKFNMRKMGFSLCPPAMCMPDELNMIPRKELLEPLLVESAEDAKFMQDQNRGILIGTQLQAWACADGEAAVVHTYGAAGQKVALSRIEATIDDEDCLDWNKVRNLYLALHYCFCVEEKRYGFRSSTSYLCTSQHIEVSLKIHTERFAPLSASLLNPALCVKQPAIETLDVKDCSPGAIHQIAVCGSQLPEDLLQGNRLVAARARHHISVLSASVDSECDWSLSSVGCTGFCSPLITDVALNPHQLPEIVYGCSNGQVCLVDVMSLSNGECSVEVVRDSPSSTEENCRTVCDYGFCPRVIFCGGGNQIKYLDLRTGLKISNIATLEEREIVMDLSNGLSNLASLYECNYLSAVTTRRALVYDLRCVGNPLISWELPQSLGIPSKVDLYSFPKFREDTSRQEGDHDSPFGLKLPLHFGETQTQSSVFDESIGEMGGAKGQLGAVRKGSKIGINIDDGLDIKFATQMSQLSVAQSQPQGIPADCAKESDADELHGTLVVSSLISGHMVQFPFSVSAAGITLSPEVDKSSKVVQKGPGRSWKSQQSRIRICSTKLDSSPRRRNETDGFPVLHENVTRSVDVSSYLTLPLTLQRTEGEIAFINILRLLERLKHRYKYKTDLSYRVLDLELAEWIDSIECSQDTLGSAFVPLPCSYNSLQTGAIVVRENFIGDILVHTCCRQQEEGHESMTTNPNRTSPVESFKAQTAGKEFTRVIRQNSIEKVPRIEPHRYLATENSQGSLLEIDITNSDLRGTDGWKLGNPNIAKWSMKQSAAVRYFSSIPVFLGRRLGKFSLPFDPVALNFLITYLELKAQMLRDASMSNETLDDWDLQCGADVWLKESGFATTMWDILRKQTITLYNTILGSKEDFEQKDTSAEGSEDDEIGSLETEDKALLSDTCADYECEENQYTGHMNNSDMTSISSSSSEQPPGSPMETCDAAVESPCSEAAILATMNELEERIAPHLDHLQSSVACRSIVTADHKDQMKDMGGPSAPNSWKPEIPDLWEVKPLVKDLLVASNLGSVHPCHAESIREHLQQTPPANGVRLVQHNVKCFPPPDLLLKSRRLDECQAWKSASENLLRTVGEVWIKEECTKCDAEVWEHAIPVQDIPFVQTWGIDADHEREKLAIDLMDRVWGEYCTELREGRKTRRFEDFPI